MAPSGPAGIFGPGQSGQLTVTLLSNDSVDGDQIPIDVNQIESGQPIDWASRKSSLQPSTIPDRSLERDLQGQLTAHGREHDRFIQRRAGPGSNLPGNLGETPVEVSGVNRLFSFLISQANGVFPMHDVDLRSRCFPAHAR